MEQNFNVSDEQLADMGKFMDDTGRVFDALYLDENGRPAKDKNGRLLDLMPSIGAMAYCLPKVEDSEPEVIETVNVGFQPAIIHTGRVVRTHEFTDEERQEISKYPTEAFLDGRFAGIIEAVGRHCHAG